MSCSDVQTIKAGDGSKLTFSFDFPYIFKSEIHVYFWNVTTKEWDEKLTTDSTYPWQITDANPTIVEFTGDAPPAPTTPTVPNEETQDNVRIRRITKVDDIRALFNPGSAIRSNDLNKNFEQLRYAIQESGCQDVPEDLKEYLEEYYWDRYDNTLYDGDTWVSDDTKIASAEAIDDRIDSKINDAITTDIATDNTGITVTDDGDGTITLGLGSGSIDFDRIKDEDIITLAEQNAGPETSNNSIFTSSASAKRFDTIVQTDTPSGDDYETGKTWLQNDDDLTLSVWNGSAWTAVTSGGTFINQPKVIYVDSGAGDDNNDGHRISRPKLTIRAALSDINSDANGDGTIISVSPGIYAETLPLDIEKNDIAIIGQSLRTCIIHPAIPEADQSTYDVDVPHSQELQTMFRVNSGSYFQNLTLTGMKASGTRGDTGSLYEDATHGLPPNQGWNFAFFPDADIKKSPYIQNCTNFSDSQIDNVNFTPHTPGEGAAGDLDSAPTGGGILVDGSVPHDDSPLRSIVCDSYTHTALDGPGIFVTNNGYLQATSSYAFFNHAHITCINGGQANLAASTSDFGRFGLLADGKSTSAIFTSNVDGAATDGDITFNINAPTAGTGWFGSDTRPANNMLVTVNSVTYPVLSATARTDSEGNDGWTVTISRPNSEDRSENDGINGDIADNASVEFFLRSMIASSGHTMEYVGSGTNYSALPENGGVPDEDNQVIERNDGKVWAATTDHKGKFKVGDFFEVDQQAGTLTVGTGSFSADLSNLEVNLSGDAEVGSNLDLGDNEITSSSGNLNLNASSDIDVNTNKIINLTDPTADQDAATKVYVDDNTIASVLDDASPQLGGNLDVNDFEILSTDNGDVTINPNGTGNIVLDAEVGIGTSSPTEPLTVGTSTPVVLLDDQSSRTLELRGPSSTNVAGLLTTSNHDLLLGTNDNERIRIDSSGNVGIGTSSPNEIVDARGAAVFSGDHATSQNDYGTEHGIMLSSTSNLASIKAVSNGSNDVAIRFIPLNSGSGSEAMRIDSSGNVGINETSPDAKLHLRDSADGGSGNTQAMIQFSRRNGGSNDAILYAVHDGSDGVSALRLDLAGSERMRIDDSGNVGIGTSSPNHKLTLATTSTDTFDAFNISSGNTSSTGYQIGVDSSGNVFHWNTTDSNINFATNNTGQVRIDNSGNLLFTRESSSSPHPEQQLKWSNDDSTSNGFYISQDSDRNGRVWHEQGLDILFATNNTERMRIDSSGNLGIGTSSPSFELHVSQSGSASDIAATSDVSSGTASRFVLGNSAGTARATFNLTGGDDEECYLGSEGSFPLYFQTNGSQRMIIHDSGRIGVATDGATGTQFYVQGSGIAQAITGEGQGANSFYGVYGVVGTGTNVQYGVYGQSNTSTSYSSGGMLGYSTQSNTYGIVGYYDTSSYYSFYGNGAVAGTSFPTVSDSRLKDIDSNLTGCLDKLANIQPVKYTWKENSQQRRSMGTDVEIGLLAQEVQAQFPELVSDMGWGEIAGNNPETLNEQLGTTLGVDYGRMVAVLIQALNEAKERIETLETKVAALEAAE